MGSKDRITIPDHLASARGKDQQLDATGEIRRRLPDYGVPWLVVTYDELRSMPLRPEDAFMLSLLDGRLTVEMLLSLSGMTEAETLAILDKLLGLGAIELHDPTPR